jgi:hypothetical protein
MPLYNPGILATGGSVTGNLTVTGNQAVSGTETVSGNAAFALNTLVGSTTALGDNGIGEIQIANATSVPTTNPTGGAVLYATGGGAFYRDSAGDVWPVPSPATTGGFTSASITESCQYTQAANSIAPDSGTLTIASVFLTAGQAIGHLGMVTSTTAATNPVHWWLAILDNTYKLVATTADQLTGAIAASTWFSIATTATYTATYTGRYYLGVMIANSAGAQPTLCSGPLPAAAMITGTGASTPLLGGKSATALTAIGTVGTTVYAAPNAAANTPFMYAAA